MKLARVNRANAGANAIPIAIMLIATPGANTAAKSSAERIAGNPCTASIRRMSASSSQPPAYPLSTPMRTPAAAPRPTAMTPTAIDVTAPRMMRERTSRPYWSVPNGCVGDGPAKRVAIDIASGSDGV